MKCPICNKEFSNGWRAVHAHMLKSHIEEYRAKGCKLSAFGITEKEEFKNLGKPKGKAIESPKKQRKPAVPDDFRPLDTGNEVEAEAYSEGYRYFSNGQAYTSVECREMGWL